MENNWVSREVLVKKMKEDLKRSENYIPCKRCGHRVLVGKTGKKICSWCKYYVFRDEKDEFIYRYEETKRREMV